MAHPIKYLVLDSNSYVVFLELGFAIATPNGSFKPDEEIIALDELQKALDQDKIKLLLPEVVKIELKRIKFEKIKEIDLIYNQAVKSIQDVAHNNKKLSQSSIKEITRNIIQVRDGQISFNKAVWKKIENIFSNKNTTLLPLNEKILVGAYKRAIMGSKPYKSGFLFKDNAQSQSKKNIPFHGIQPDCIILENIKMFINTNTKSSYELHLVTNDGDFYTDNEKTELDENIKSELGITDVYQSLSDYLNKILGTKIKKVKLRMSKEQETFPLVTNTPAQTGDIVQGMQNVKI